MIKFWCSCCYEMEFDILGEYRPGYVVIYKCLGCGWIEIDLLDNGHLNEL